MTVASSRMPCLNPLSFARDAILIGALALVPGIACATKPVATVAPGAHEVLVTSLGTEYGLSVEEVTRYENLMAGPRAHWSADTHPLMVLGVNARSPAERQRYAELIVEDDRKRTEAILALSRSVQQVWLRKYGNAPLFAQASTPAAPAADAGLLSTDRVLIAFTPGACLPCGPAIAGLQAQIAAHGGPGIDLYFLVERDEDIHAFARQQLISPDAVQRKQITLNRADPTWMARIGVQPSSLPMAIRRRGDQLTPIDLQQLARRKAWGNP